VSVTRYLLGLLLAAIALGPIVAASSAWRGRLLARWSGAPAVLVDIVITLAAVTCMAELLGSFGLFRLGPMTVGLAVVGLTGWFAARRLRGHVSRAELTNRENEGSLVAIALSPQNTRGALFAALAATSVVVADWGARTVDALNHGMTTPDTIWYHMPFAARFVQDGSITALHFVDFHSGIAFYPENGELVHALGILFLGNDVLSPLVNMGWLALVLLGAWCVGRPFGVAPVTLAGAAVLMATPGLVATQPGGAYTDVVGLALLASAVAVLVNSERPSQIDSLPACCVAALAAGMTLGTKFTFVAPVVALTLGVWLVAPHGARLRQGSLWVVLVSLTGGFWYLRNLVSIGNPLPYALHLGPVRLPGPPDLAPTSSVATFLTNGRDWHTYFLPGFRESLGPAWWAVLGLTVAGLALGACAGVSPLHRMLALVGIASGAAFVFTPQPLTVPILYPNVPYNFVYNLRYSFAALIIGLIVLPITPVMTGPRMRWWLLGAFGLVLVAMQLDSTIWPTSLFSQQFAPAVRGVDSQIGLLLGVVTFALGSLLILGEGERLAQRPPAAAIAVTGLVVLGLVFGLQQFYLRERYLNTQPLAPLYAWAQHVRDTRMAITGLFSNDSYPLDGPDDSNYVQVVGRSGPHGAFSPILDCGEFRRVIDTGRYADVITITAGAVRNATAIGSKETLWTSQDPSARLIFRRTVYGYVTKITVISVFHLDGRLDPGSCPSP
jgi:hypothetical protein